MLFVRKLGQLPVARGSDQRIVGEIVRRGLAHRCEPRTHARVESAIAAALPHVPARTASRRAWGSARERSLTPHRRGTTFSNLLNGIGRDLSALSEDQPCRSARSSGCSGTATLAFSHAYKQWTGTTPREAASRMVIPQCRPRLTPGGRIRRPTVETTVILEIVGARRGLELHDVTAST